MYACVIIIACVHFYIIDRIYINARVVSSSVVAFSPAVNIGQSLLSCVAC